MKVRDFCVSLQELEHTVKAAMAPTSISKPLPLSTECWSAGKGLCLMEPLVPLVAAVGATVRVSDMVRMKRGELGGASRKRRLQMRYE